jgi:hypothetical protein
MSVQVAAGNQSTQLMNHTTHANSPTQKPYQQVLDYAQAASNNIKSLSTQDRCAVGAKPMAAPMAAMFGNQAGRVALASHPAVQQAQQQQQQQSQQQQQAQQQAQQQQIQQQQLAMQQQMQRQQQQQMQIAKPIAAPMTSGGSSLEQAVSSILFKMGAAQGVHDEDVRKAIQAARSDSSYRVNRQLLSEMKSAVGEVKRYDVPINESLLSLHADPSKATVVIPYHQIVGNRDVVNPHGMILTVHKMAYKMDMPVSIKMDIVGIQGNVHSPKYDCTAMDVFHPNTSGDYLTSRGAELFSRTFTVDPKLVQKYAGVNIDEIFADRMRIGEGMSVVVIDSKLHQFLKDDPELAVAKFGKPADKWTSIAGRMLMFADKPLDEIHADVRTIKSNMSDTSLADGVQVVLSRLDGEPWNSVKNVCDHLKGKELQQDVLAQRGHFNALLEFSFMLPNAGSVGLATGK